MDAHEERQSRAEALMDKALAHDGKIVIECASSFIRAIGYDIHTKIMIVSINYGKRTIEYTYKNIPWEMFVDFVESDSKGVWFNDHLKPGGIYYGRWEQYYRSRSGRCIPTEQT